MKESLDKLNQILLDYPNKLSGISEEIVSHKPSPIKWSGKEILGHLIDSASNNHQRFIRTQQINHLLFPGYEQTLWVKLQHYQEESWSNLVKLWESYNHHLLHILRNIPEDKWENHCVIGNNPPKSLNVLVEEYVSHVEHHLQQISNLKSS